MSAPAMFDAAGKGDAAAVRRLIKEGAPVDWHNKDRNGYTALIEAARNCQREVVAMLLHAGASVNAANNDGWTALIVAALSGQKEVVPVLLEAGADPAAKSKDGKTARDKAEEKGHAAVVALLDAHAAAKGGGGKGGAAAQAPAAAPAPSGKELYDVARKGDAAAVRRLIKSGAPVDGHKSEDGMTALIWAAYNGQKEVVAVLLEAGASVNAANNTGRTALIVAAGNGEKEVVPVLLEAGADPTAKDEDGNTARDWAELLGHAAVVALLDAHAAAPAPSGNELYDAAGEGDAAAVRRLIKEGAPVDWHNEEENGKTALIKAALNGKKEVVAVLLEAGASVNAAAKNGDTALMAAAAYGEKEVVPVLLEAGADPTAKNKGGKTARDRAKWVGHAAVVALLDAHAAAKGGGGKGGAAAQAPAAAPAPSGKELYDAAGKGDAAAVRRLTKAGAPVDGRNKDDRGDTALIKAAYHGQKEVVPVLLEAGASIEATDKNGYTALMAAASCGEKEVVPVLLEAGADANAANNDGATALMMAAYNGKKEVVAVLLEAGADPTAKNKFEGTARDYAKEKGHAAVVELLDAPDPASAARALLDAHAAAKELYDAAGKGDAAAVGRLIKAGAPVDGYKNRDGKTARDWAEEKGHAEIVEILEAYAAAKAAAEKKAAALGLLEPLKALSLGGDVLPKAVAAAVTFCSKQGAESAAELVRFEMLDGLVAALKDPDDESDLLKPIQAKKLCERLQSGASTAKDGPPGGGASPAKFDLFISHATKDDSKAVFEVVKAYMDAKEKTIFNPTTHLSHVVEINKAAMQDAVKRSKLVIAALSDAFFESSWCAAEVAAAKEAGIKVIPVYSGDEHGANQIDRWVKEFKGKTSARAQKFPEFGYVFNENARDALNKQNPASTRSTLNYLATLV